MSAAGADGPDLVRQTRYQMGPALGIQGGVAQLANVVVAPSVGLSIGT